PEADYGYVREELVPVMLELKQQGKIRHIGITEAFATDPGHRMLQRAVADDCWEVMMVGFNLLNQSARTRVLQPAAEKGIGILDMFAVRRALVSQALLSVFMKGMLEQGLIDPDRYDGQNPLGFLLERGGYGSLTELAYRFCISEPGIHSILSGTGNPQHLEQNLRDIGKGPMPAEDRETLMSLFERVDSVSGN
ncbi:MAG TPA: aldo/keto reductase, partial [Clostridia bacterium]